MGPIEFRVAPDGEVYFKEGFIDRYVEKEVQKMEESIGRDLKKSIKIGNGDE